MASQFGASSSSSSFSSSSSAPIQSWTYHVFLSFRGEDTRNTFTGHLHSNLVQKGIRTFIDDGLQRGEEISSALLEAIEESKISVIVFSENYASSKWCLEELVKIMQCKESKQQIVYPVFYKVDPSHVRNQTGSFGEALACHDDLKKVVRWKTALTKAGHLCGWPFSQGEHESEFIRKIVEEISKQVSILTNLNREKYFVGIKSRLENLEKLLCVGESDVRMVGVWGIGGLGKTTIAKAVYDSIAHKFEGSCILENVRERSLKNGGQAELQELLLSKTLGLKELKITSLDEGSNIIKERLSHKRVLLILDDVNDLDQLKSLVGESNWFGPGSRIIITTRDRDLLRRHDVSRIYQVEKLSHLEASELFNINAFKEKEHISDYIEQIDSVIRYAEGLPLVLEVLGSCLHGRSIDTWKDTLECFKQNPKHHQFLKLSYDALEPLVKEVFLHIACFFKGSNKNYVMNILEGCDLRPNHSIQILIEKAIISITEGNNIWMHDVLEEMGKEIVCQESSEPGERSRLWLYKDVYHVFAHNTGTNKVKGIMVKRTTNYDQQIPLNSESFFKLNSLQILQISSDIFYGDCVSYLPNELRLFDWVDCPLQYFPSNFYPNKLVVMKASLHRQMPWICMSLLRKGLQIMCNLKSLSLIYCKAVTKFSDLPTCPNLEKLEISRNQSFKKFDPVQEMKSLKKLNLRCTAIKEFPSSAIRHLINLEKLELRGCLKLEHVASNIFELPHLQLLDLHDCDKLVIFPTKSEVSTESNSLQDKHCAPLFVKLKKCKNLVQIGEFPREIYGLDANHCVKLKRISKLSNILGGKDSRMIHRMNLTHCFTLSSNLQNEVAKMKKNLPDDSVLTALFSLLFSCWQSEYQVYLPARDDIPEWFTCRMHVTKKGLQECNFRIDFPGNFKWEDKGLAFCASTDVHRAFRHPLRIYINGVTIIEASDVPWNHKPRYYMPCYDIKIVQLYYMPFDDIIKRLGESGLQPPSICRVKFEFKLDSMDEDGMLGSLGVHVVMPGWEGPSVNGVLSQGTDSYSEDNAEA